MSLVLGCIFLRFKKNNPVKIRKNEDNREESCDLIDSFIQLLPIFKEARAILNK